MRVVVTPQVWPAVGNERALRAGVNLVASPQNGVLVCFSITLHTALCVQRATLRRPCRPGSHKKEKRAELKPNTRDYVSLPAIQSSIYTSRGSRLRDRGQLSALRFP